MIWLQIVKHIASNSANNDGLSRDQLEVCDNVESLSINAPPESTGVTTFVQEACEAVDVLGKHFVSNSSLKSQSDLQNLTDYFKRPRLITTFDLAASTVAALYTNDLTPSSLFDIIWPEGLARLSGVRGVRFKTVFTLQIAATPFHQGVLALNWQYGATAPGSVFVRSRLSPTSTNIPHVRADLSVDTMVQLHVPFLHTSEYIIIGHYGAATNIPYGRVALNTLTPIQSVAGMGLPSVKLFIHLEDFELVGATSLVINSVALQSNKKLKPINEEFENEAYPYSSGIHALSRTVTWIAKGIPSLSSIAGPTAWFLGKAAGAIRHFGFSKPQVQDPIVRMFPIRNIGENNVDVPSATVMSGPLASNQLKFDGTFASTDVDEMSLAFVLSQWSQICRGAITTSDAVGTTLYASPTSPSAMWFRAGSSAPYCNTAGPVLSGAGANSFIPSSLFYFAQMFRLWRGGFKYRFTFSKTKMHAGRVMATWIPFSAQNQTLTDAFFNVSIPEASSGLVQPDSYSVIFDLRDSNVFEFEVPFLAENPFYPFTGYNGSISLTLVDTLKASSVVSNTVDFLVEVCAAPGFELALPVGPLYPAHPTGAPRLQSGKLLSVYEDDISQHTVGESIGSLKQLIMIPKVSVTGTVPVSTTSSVTILPWWYQPTPSVLTPGPIAHQNEAFGFAGNVASCYAFVKGSTDAHAYVLDSSSTAVTLWSQVSQIYNNTTTTGPNRTSTANAPRVFASQSTPLHVRFPAYQNGRRFWSFFNNTLTWVCSFGNADANPTLPFSTLIPTHPVTVGKLFCNNTGTTASAKIVITRCAGDDAFAGHYMGPPPLLLTSTLVAAGDPDSVGYI